MPEWIPEWKLPKRTTDAYGITCRLFHFEDENTFGVDIGWCVDKRLFVTLYYTHPSGELVASTSKRPHNQAPALFSCESSNHPITHDKIPDQQEVLQEIALAARIAAADLPSQKLIGWAEDIIAKHQDQLVDTYERYHLGLRTFIETASQLSIPQPESFLAVLPEKYLVMRSKMTHSKSPYGISVQEKYIAYDQKRTPYLLSLDTVYEPKYSYFTAKPIYFVTREVSPTSAWLPDMTPSSEAVVFQLPASDANLLAVYSSAKAGGQVRGNGLSYLYYWKVDDLNPGVFRLSIHPPGIDIYASPQHKRPYQGVFTFSTAPLQVYRKYVLGEDITEEISQSALANLMLE